MYICQDGMDVSGDDFHNLNAASDRRSPLQLRFEYSIRVQAVAANSTEKHTLRPSMSHKGLLSTERIHCFIYFYNLKKSSWFKLLQIEELKKTHTTNATDATQNHTPRE